MVKTTRQSRDMWNSEIQASSSFRIQAEILTRGVFVSHQMVHLSSPLLRDKANRVSFTSGKKSHKNRKTDRVFSMPKIEQSRYRGKNRWVKITGKQALDDRETLE